MRIIAITLCLAIASCSFLDRYDPGFVERYNNLEHLKLLKVGMTKQEVLNTMGKPLVKEKYNTPNIWFYYTDWDWADAARTQSECTPLVFEKGKLIGWGQPFYRDYIHKDWLFNPASVFIERTSTVDTPDTDNN